MVGQHQQPHAAAFGQQMALGIALVWHPYQKLAAKAAAPPLLGGTPGCGIL